MQRRIASANDTQYTSSGLVLGLVTMHLWRIYTIPAFSRPLCPTHPGHPFVGRCNECWRWSRPPPLEKKRRVLRNSRNC